MALKFKAYAGRRRVSANLDATSAGFAKSMRASMQQIIDNYQDFVDSVEEVTPQVLMNSLEPTFQKSQNYCPVDSGKMKASGYLIDTTFRGHPRVELGYGKNGEPDYTARQHEDLEFRHKAPTRAKWLQSALEEDAQDVQQRIIDGMKGAVS